MGGAPIARMKTVLNTKVQQNIANPAFSHCNIKTAPAPIRARGRIVARTFQNGSKPSHEAPLFRLLKRTVASTMFTTASRISQAVTSGLR